MDGGEWLGRVKEWLGVCDIAIDLGTANTLIYARGQGVVLDEPSVVVQHEDGTVRAIGREAKAMYGRLPEGLRATRPMKDGVIADFDVCDLMIRHFLKGVIRRNPVLKPVILIAVPSGITQVDKRAVIEAGLASGASKVLLMEEPMAAAVGVGKRLKVEEPRGNMVVDIGGGTTEIAVISMLSTVYSESIRVAGDVMDEAIQAYVRERFNVLIGLFESERVKMTLGSAVALDQPEEVKVRGRDLVRGVPCEITLDDGMVREALKEPIDAIVRSIRRALDKAPPELASDISDQGILLAGGGALIRGLGPRLKQETELRSFRPSDPLKAVVKGTGKVLENRRHYARVILN